MKTDVLHILKQNQYQWISGEDICRQLSVSRTMVWKHIRSLKQDGYDIETQPRLGYRLVSTPDRLYPMEILTGLNTNFMGQRVLHHHTLTSTNDEAKKLARQGVRQGTVVVAEQQTAGKGRLGRQWYSNAGEDVLLSVILHPNINPAQTPQVSMLAAVAVARAVEKTCGIQVGIKWPNDLLVQGKKICGVLVEIGAEIDRVKYVVLGIGINTNSLAALWPDVIRDNTTSLREECGEKVSRVELVRAIMEELEYLYNTWQQEGFNTILKTWRTWCVSQHCQARVETLQGSYHGWIEGVNNNGALLLRLSDGSIQSFLSGDVSLRF